MKFIAIFAAISAIIASVSAGSTCDSFTTEKSCMSGKEGSDSCSWCSSAAVGSTCFTSTDAKGLPSSVFTCKFQSAYSAGGSTCDSFTTEKSCMSGKEGSDSCSWCSSAAVGSTCFTSTDAKGLPSSVFTCKFQSAYSAGGSTCDSFTTEKSCMSGKEGSDSCSWCSSAAVGSTCFTSTDAKGLPSSVFTCKFQSAYSAGGSTCDSFTTEKSCMSGKEGSDSCSWCSSAAVGSTCFTSTDAKGLPSSVFTCKFQSSNAYVEGARSLRGN